MTWEGWVALWVGIATVAVMAWQIRLAQKDAADSKVMAEKADDRADNAERIAEGALQQATKLAEATDKMAAVIKEQYEEAKADREAPGRLKTWIGTAFDEGVPHDSLGHYKYTIEKLNDLTDLYAARLAVEAAGKDPNIARVEPVEPKRGEPFSIYTNFEPKYDPEHIKREATKILEGWVMAGQRLGLEKVTDEGELLNTYGFTIAVTLTSDVHVEAARMARSAKDVGILSINPTAFVLGSKVEIVVKNPKYIDFGD